MRIKYTGSYENDIACRNFISVIGDCLFDENVKKKLELVNFISILCDGSTNKGVTEQEVLFVVFTDPETHLPTMTFFEVVAPEESRYAPSLKQAIIQAFKEHSLESMLSKLVFIFKSALIKLFQEDYPWISFIWCFSHRLDLSLKDALTEFIEPVQTSLRHLYFLYKKSSKKHRD